MTDKTLEFVLTLNGDESVLENMQSVLAEALTGFVEAKLSEMGTDGVTIKVNHKLSPARKPIMGGLNSEEWLDKKDI